MKATTRAIATAAAPASHVTGGSHGYKTKSSASSDEHVVDALDDDRRCRLGARTSGPLLQREHARRLAGAGGQDGVEELADQQCAQRRAGAAASSPAEQVPPAERLHVDRDREHRRMPGRATSSCSTGVRPRHPRSGRCRTAMYAKTALTSRPDPRERRPGRVRARATELPARRASAHQRPGVGRALAQVTCTSRHP